MKQEIHCLLKYCNIRIQSFTLLSFADDPFIGRRHANIGAVPDPRYMQYILHLLIAITYNAPCRIHLYDR
jgi:hypothetical protein